MANSTTNPDEVIDHYLQLRLPTGEKGAALTQEEIHKAYKSESRLRHPDKRPDDPTATQDFQRLRASYDILRDQTLRAQFDARLRAKRHRADLDAALDTRRRKHVSDLERREREAESGVGVDPHEAAKREEKRKAEQVKRELDDFKAGFATKRKASNGEEKREDAKEGEKMKMDMEKMLKVSWEGRADYYTSDKLREIFQKFGDVQDVIIKTKKSRSRGSALVDMASKEAALAAINDQSLYAVLSTPLLVLPVIQAAEGFLAKSVGAHESKVTNIDGAGFADYEASTFKKLQEALKKKKKEQ